MYNYILIAAVSFVLSLSGSLFAVKFFPSFGLVDRPHKYGLFRKAIPYYGGLIIYLSFWIAALIFMPFDLKLFGVFIASTLLVLVSFVDDLRNLAWYYRLPVQFVAAFIIIIFGVGILEISNPFGGILLLNQLVVPVTVFGKSLSFVVFADLLVIVWIVIMMNAMNWMDGVNGLPSGLTVIASLVIFFLSREDFHLVNQTGVQNLSLILAFVCLAFWFFDFYPAKILMGDSGSMFIGFMLAVLSVFSGAKIATTALVLGFPLLDFVWVIFRRIFYEKKSPFKGDLKHLHHRFLKLGFSDRQTLFIIYFLCASFGAISLLSSNSTEKLIAIVSMAFVMFILAIWVILRRQ